MIACNQGQEEPVQLLLQNGADPNVLDQVRHAVVECKFMSAGLCTVLQFTPQVGRTCLHFIETVRNPRILEALCNHDADVNSAKSVSCCFFVWFCSHNSGVCVCYLVYINTLCCFLQDTRITPLTVACVFGDLGSVQTLVERGADPNYLKHQVPLHCNPLIQSTCFTEWMHVFLGQCSLCYHH